jgi:hypothetical protein
VNRLHTIAAALACTLVAAVVAACGGTTKAGVSGEAGASLIRSGALAYVAIDSDLDSSQWQQVDELLKKFPAHDRWLADLRRELPAGITYDDDIAPALGPEVDVAVGEATAAETSFVVLTKPDSVDKARALVRKLASQDDEQPATRVVDGWFVVSKSQAMIDRTLKGDAAESLADDTTFKDAVAKLPDDALAKAYVNGRQLGELADQVLGSGAKTAAAGGALPYGLDKIDWIAASLAAKENGVRFELAVKGEGGSSLVNGGPSYASKLISGVPSGSLAFLSFRGGSLGDQLKELRRNPTFGQAFQEAEKQLGMRLDEVIELFAHEVAFYVRKGPGIPEFSLVLEAPDTQQALTTIDRLAGRIAELAHTGGVRKSTENGLDVSSIEIKPVTIRWAGFDGRVLLTTGPTGIDDYRADGPKLADDPDYKHALDAAGAPDENGGVIYVNLHDSVQLIKNYLGISGERMPREIAENLEPLQSLVAYNATDGDLTRTVAFLEIK